MWVQGTSEWRSPTCDLWADWSLTLSPCGTHVICGASLIIHYPQQTETAKQNEAIAQCHTQSGRKRHKWEQTRLFPPLHTLTHTHTHTHTHTYKHAVDWWGSSSPGSIAWLHFTLVIPGCWRRSSSIWTYSIEQMGPSATRIEGKGRYSVFSVPYNVNCEYILQAGNLLWMLHFKNNSIQWHWAMQRPRDFASVCTCTRF